MQEPKTPKYPCGEHLLLKPPGRKLRSLIEEAKGLSLGDIVRRVASMGMDPDSLSIHREGDKLLLRGRINPRDHLYPREGNNSSQIQGTYHREDSTTQGT